jgi:hypothetical protein
MPELTKVTTASRRKSDQPESMTRVYSAPHMDNQTAFYAVTKEENGQDEDFAIPSYTDKDGDSSSRDLESGSGEGGADPNTALETTETARSERDPKLVSICSLFPKTIGPIFFF